MRGLFAAFCLLLSLTAATAETRVLVRVSITEQRLRVYHEGRPLFIWAVSTAKAPKVTPPGSFTPEFLSRDHRSKRYSNAPMPWAVFYHGNYAIHGTNQIKRLGKPASHGCVRLHPDNARILFRMIRAEGLANTRVVIAP